MLKDTKMTCRAGGTPPVAPLWWFVCSQTDCLKFQFDALRLIQDFGHLRSGVKDFVASSNEAVVAYSGH